MPFTQKFRDQLLTVQDPAVGFLVKELDTLFASLAFLSPLADNLKVPYVKSGALVTTSTGLPSIHQQVRCQVYDSAAAGQVIGTGAFTALTFDTEVFDIGDMHNTTFTGRLTVPVGGDGLYLLLAVVPFATNAVGQRLARFTLNGTAVNPASMVPATSAVYVQTVTHQLWVPAIAGDYFGVDAYQDSGGNLAVGDGGQSRVQLAAMKVAAA